MRCFTSLLTLLVVMFLVPATNFSYSRGTVIEDFESGSVILGSYPDQDQEPNAWELTVTNTYGETAYALRLYGNTWKTQTISPVALSDSSVWQVAAFVERRGEMQGFGVSDGTNELFYTFAGEQLPEEPKWWTVYQGAFPLDEWYAYLFPVGRDWQVTYGYLPTIVELIYVNDDDGGGNSVVIIDEIYDVSADQPITPTVMIQYTIESSVKLNSGKYRVGVQFYGKVFDPDSDSHEFHWDFGDSSTSSEQNPIHQFLVSSDYTYTVGLIATDPEGMAGYDTCQVMVEIGEPELPITVNFVGDVFTGRAYEYPGGIIDTYGIEALFEPTLPIFGLAADVSVCNLEVCYTDRGTPHPTKSVVFRSRPENIVGLAYAGIDIVDIGNNHIIDYGVEGMLQCLELLAGLNIPYSGAGINEYFALQPAFWTEQGIRLAFLGQCNRTGRQWNYQPFLDAGYNKPGFAYFIPHNVEDAIAAVRDQADIVVIQFHSGDEYETIPPPRSLLAGAPEDDSLAPGNHPGTDSSWLVPPPVEAMEIRPDDLPFHFRNEPTPGDRELRRLAIDLGADVVINHHPHVLQGFESYSGKLIAHSLGNFIFDLYYPETMPTMILTLEMNKEQITGYFFVPAWIDDYIPQPATGQLGREIMDRLADYSRPMNALVAVDLADPIAHIYLSRDGVDSTVTAQVGTTSLVEEDGYRISPPVTLSGQGNLSRIVALTGDVTGDWEISWGREILWHGGFEAEGATFWDINTSDEWLDESEAHSGLRSLAVRRHEYDTDQTGTDLEKHLPCAAQNRHTGYGWMKSDNSAEARIMVRFYRTRSETILSSTDLADRFTGSQDWTFQWRNLETPSNAAYFEVRCSNEPPQTGTGHAWFDDLALIAWEPWVQVSGPVSIPSPNNYRYLQIRNSNPSAVSATVTYEETAYTALVTTVAQPTNLPSRLRLRNFPNPFNPRTTIELSVPTTGQPLPVELCVFDVRGRKIATLFRGPLSGGTRHGFSWNGRDDQGHPAPSGVYFARTKLGDDTLTQKMLLVR